MSYRWCIWYVLLVATGCKSQQRQADVEEVIRLDVVSIVDFGAVPNDNIDDSEAIQKAVNFAIGGKNSSHVYCPPGVYDLDQGIVIANQDNKGEFFFTTLTLSGHISTYSSNQRLGSSTVFRLRKPTFCIAFQTARNCVVENIVFEGSSTYTGNISHILNGTEKDWGQASNARTDIFSPSCAIVIDPFHVNVASDHRYPGCSDYYKNQATGGSSMVLIRGCSFTKHYIAFANNPSGVITNGDNMRIEQSNVSFCHTFWSAGQTQSRANSISNVYAMFVHTFIDGTQIGSQNGTPPFVRNLNLAGFCKQLVNTNTGFSGINFSQCYLEGVWSLGMAIGDYVSFDQCQIKFAKPTSEFFMPPFLLHTNNVATFNNCDIQFFDNCKTRMPILFNASSVKISGGSIQGGVLLAGGYTNAGGDAMHNVSLDNVQIRCLGKIAGKPNSAIPKSNLKDEIIMGGEVRSTNGGILFVNHSTTYHTYFTETQNIKINQTDKTAFFTTTKPGQYKIGDNLVTDQYVPSKSAGFSKNIKVRSPLGFIVEINGNQITLQGVPMGFPEGSASLFCVTYPQIQPEVVGSTRVNSNLITNVDFDEMNWQPKVGDRVYTRDFSEGSYITIIDLKKKQITMSTYAIPSRNNATNGPVEYQRAK